MTHVVSIETAQQCNLSSAAVEGNTPFPSAPFSSDANRGIWSDLPMATGIATLVCYAGVFGDVIGVEEMATRLGVADQDEFYSALNELHHQGKIILKDGFAGLPDFEDKLCAKASKVETTRQLIDSRMQDLRKLGRNPIIKFVGISGSLAANNPTKDSNGHLDIDLFLITRSQCLWLYVIPRGLRNLFPKAEKEPTLCDNYIMDELSLKVNNRNFFTATDIRNLIPVSGIAAYRRFLQSNSWVDYYYPGFTGCSAPTRELASSNLVNKSLYFIYTILRCVKHRTLEPLKCFSCNTDPLSSLNHNRLTQQCGGYQALVQKKFTRLAMTWFRDLVGDKLIDKLFPDELSDVIRKQELEYFRIHTTLDYSKYA